MPRELGEKSQLIIATLTEATGPLDGDVAVVVIRTDHADRLLCMAGSARMKGVTHGA